MRRAFTRRMNCRHRLWGRLFGDRYKAIVVETDNDENSPGTLIDYIHLNPARAGLAGGKAGKLAGYRWSSMPCYAKGKGPKWLEMDRVLNSFELAETGRGRRAYVGWLEARAANDGGCIDQTAQDALRRGWYLGEETFRDRLLDLVDKVKGIKVRKRDKAECVGKDYWEKDAERLIRECASELGLPTAASELSRLKKGDGRKAMLAALLRRRSIVSFEWIAIRLHMGHPASVSRLVCSVKQNLKQKKRVDELDKMLQCAD